MLISYIRSSSYNNWDYCQLQYFITYVLGWPSVSGKKAQMGTIVHKVMEVLAACKYDIQNHPDKKDREVEDDKIGVVEFTERKLNTKKFVKSLLDRTYEHYTEKCVHNYTKADYRFCEKLVEQGLTYNDGQFDPRTQNILAPEASFDLAIEEDWAKFSYDVNGEQIEGQLAIKGTIDLVTSLENDVIEVVDYKTGQRKNWATGEEKTYEKLLEDPQLLLYNYAISRIYPQYEQSIMTIFYIRDGGPFSMCFDESDNQKFLGMLKDRFQEIKRNVNPKPCSRERRSFKCNRLCQFYKDKDKWDGTNVSMCEKVEESLKLYGIEETVRTMTKPGHSIGYYESPG